MKIVINGTPSDVEEEATVAHVVRALTDASDASRGVAVALNEAVVPRGDWATTFLREDDRVEILTAVQGG